MSLDTSEKLAYSRLAVAQVGAICIGILVWGGNYGWAAFLFSSILFVNLSIPFVNLAKGPTEEGK